MIKQVTIKNFQSHKASTFEFCPTTNAIIGSSNNGKTVVLRAISWVVTNRPSADSLISHWAKDEKGNQTEDMSVTIETDEHIVTRLKTKKTNTYIIDGKTLEAVGRDVPKEVSDALNMNEVNIQKQMDAPFLLSDSPGEVARFFNKLIKLDKIDIYLSSIESKKRKTRDSLQLATENKDKTEKELQQYTWTDKAENLIVKLKELAALSEELYKNTQLLKQQINDKRNLDSTIQQVTETVDNGITIIRKLEATTEQKESLYKETTALSELLETYIKNKQTISDFTPVITKAIGLVEWLGTYNPERYTSPIQNLSTTLREYYTQKKILDLNVDVDYAEKLIKRITKLNEKITTEASGILTLKESIDLVKSSHSNDINDQIKELEGSLPPFCPTCGGPIHG